MSHRDYVLTLLGCYGNEMKFSKKKKKMWFGRVGSLHTCTHTYTHTYTH